MNPHLHTVLVSGISAAKHSHQFWWKTVPDCSPECIGSYDGGLISQSERARPRACRLLLFRSDCVIAAAAVSITMCYIRQFDVRGYNPAVLPERSHIWDFQLILSSALALLTRRFSSGHRGGLNGRKDGHDQFSPQLGCWSLSLCPEINYMQIFKKSSNLSEQFLQV